MKKFKAALFDLDGVVFNTEDQYTVFWGNQFREFYPDQPGLELAIKGQTLQQIYDKYFSGDLADKRELITRRLDLFEQTMEFEYVKGFEAFVADLKANGVKTAVVTSSNQAKMASVYEARPDFKSLFDEILTAEDFDRSKPDPDCYQKAAQRFGAGKDECVVFEDSFNGLKSGRAAGMAVVGLATTNSVESISPLADKVIGDYSDFSYENCVNVLKSRESLGC